ncbi:hypothetical protein BM477_01230 [Boudabousia marimammalium]|uniref:Alpha/beta hydrolase n=2 Tax=Boudabousia marimammalium TaxID=156892 RepID=A0A1Q5PSW9_9ACTO|nr:hypothetical protein BM477_01230 [Boudabousia marimammalium]
MERLEGFYFDNPWFMVTFVRGFSNLAGAGSLTIRTVLSALQQLQYSQRREVVLDSLQTTGYRSFMAAYLTLGTAMGYFRGGPVHVRLIRHNDRSLRVLNEPPFIPPAGEDSAHEGGLWPEQDQLASAVEALEAIEAEGESSDYSQERAERAKRKVLRKLHAAKGLAGPTQPAVFSLHRVKPPRTLADTLTDLDDLYWSASAGMVMKVVAIGEFPHYRWVVIAPGTDHMAATTIANPADTESNIREMLDLRSAARAGVERALNSAMEALEVPVELRQQQQILMVGHSQSGVTAHALAAEPLYEARISHVLTIGSPSRGISLPYGVRSVSVEHIQDCIPWMDGLDETQIDGRVMVRRSLDKPRRNPLHYAHAVSTYLDTVKLLEKETERKLKLFRAGKGRLDRVTKEVLALQAMLPRPDEPTQVLFYEIAQEVLEWAPLRQVKENWISQLVPDADAMVAALVERSVFDPAGVERELDEDAREALEWAVQVRQARQGSLEVLEAEENSTIVSEGSDES